MTTPIAPLESSAQSANPQDWHDLTGGMSIWECMRVAWRGLTSNKMRTGLTMLGIIIGVGAVIGMVSMGQGASKQVASRINDLGTNLLTVMPGDQKGSWHSAAAATLKMDDAKAIESKFKNSVKAVAPQARGSARYKVGDKEFGTQIVGATPAYTEVNNAPIVSGRFITDEDVAGLNKVAVVGKTILSNLYDDPNKDPIGGTIELNKIPFTIIGVLKEKGSGAWGQDQDDMIVVPVTTALRRLFNRVDLGSIGVEATKPETMDLATEQITSLLRSRHHLQPPFPDNDDFRIRSQASLLETSQSVTGTMTSLLAGVAVVSLVVGGIGIMNIMLVSVTERTREIGLRKAIGATSGDILMQFLIEALVMSLLGGLIGILMGVGFSFWVGSQMGWGGVVDPGIVFVAVGVSAAIGMVFGIYPAAKAARQNPIDALRYE